MTEIWKNIEGYENYQVSNLGRVKSLNYHHSGKEHILKCILNSSGYYKVNLYKDGKTKNLTIHRLVARAFIPNPENKSCIDHINTDKADNRVENLRWCTYKENMGNPLTKARHAEIAESQKGEKGHWFGVLGKHHHSSKPVVQFTKDGYFVKKWDSTSDVERELKIYNSSISACCKGRIKSAGGYSWKLINDIPMLESSLCVAGRLTA